MHVSHLGLTNFRNFTRLELELPSQPIVLWGDNGQGKSNLLESLHFLATTRSPYATTERQLISWPAWQEAQPFARAVALIQRQRGPLSLDILLQARPSQRPPSPGQESEGMGISKRIRMNQLARRALDVIGELKAVMFSPQDVELVGGSPSLRRRFMDMAISQLDRRYARSLQRLNQVLLQRNSLLRAIRERSAQPDQLDFWNEQLVENSSYIVQQRGRFLSSVELLADEIHRHLTGGQEGLRLAYLAAMGRKEPLEETSQELSSLRERLTTALQQQRNREIGAGMSLIGPHRDDLQFFVSGVDMNVYASRGQQRTIALALKLGEARHFLAQGGEEPLLLLDDVLSELDASRQAYLLDSIPPQQQAFLTTTHLEACPPQFLRQATVLQVQGGCITPGPPQP